MEAYLIISLLAIGVIVILVLLAVQFHWISKERIAKRVTLEKMLVLATIYGIVTIGFGLIYFWMHLFDLGPLLFTQDSPATFHQYFLHSLYFSVVTMFTVGYGDIVPVGWGRFVAVVQVMLGYILSAAFVITWTRHVKSSD